MPEKPAPGVYRRTAKDGSARWDVSYRDPETGKQRWKTKPTLREANAFKAEADAARTSPATTKWVDPHQRVTLAEYALTYHASREHDQRETTRNRQQSILRTHIADTELGRMPLTQIRREHVDRWVAECSQRVERSTLLTIVGFVRTVLAYAVENQRIAAAPVVRVSTKRRRVDDERERKIVVPTGEQVHALAAAMRDRERAMVLVQAGAGLRVSELFALRGVDCRTRFGDAPSVAVTAQLSRTGQRVPCKTDESHRVVPISAATAAAIDAHLAAYPLDDPTDYVFRTRAGRPYLLPSYARTFAQACDRADLPARFTTHALRHYFATTLLRAGLSPVAVGRLLGHTDGTLVLKVYGHHMPADDDLAREALQAALSGTTDAQRIRAV